MVQPAPGRRGLAVLGFGLALVAAAGAVRPALAHAELRASEPAEGTMLPASPGHVSLSFTEPMRITSLRLFDEAGRELPLRREGERAAAAAETRASLPGPLPPGAYRLEYRGLSGDGHVGGGAVRFRVGNGGATAR